MLKMNIFDRLDYAPETGVFTWATSGKGIAHFGCVAGSVNDNGYVVIMLSGKNYRAHRIAWMKTYGTWPRHDIDHIDGNRTNNRIINLRDVSRSENLQNQQKVHLKQGRTSTYLGVMRVRNTKRYVAQIGLNGTNIYLGSYPTEKLAHQAYLDMKRKIHPTCTI